MKNLDKQAIHFWLSASTADARATTHYRVAEQAIVSDLPLSFLGPWQKSEELVLLEEASLPAFSVHQGSLAYKGAGSFASGTREVECWWDGDLVKLNIDGEPQVLICTSSSTVWNISGSKDGSVPLEEIMLGPALIILLALHDTWCLHAGSVLTDHGVIAFCAESGFGKSTLARGIDAGWRRIGDDILPITINHNSEVNVLAEFPQLKLGADEQYVSLDNPARPLQAIFRIQPEGGENEISAKRLSSSDALLECVRHTVSSKLFGAELLKLHIVAMKAVVGSVPVFALQYPRDISRLPDVRALVRKTVSDLEDSP